MPARIVIVHDEPDFADSLTAALRLAGYEVATFINPTDGWNALDEARRVELLITRVKFPPGNPNGISLARMARYKRPAIRIIFAALPEFAEHTKGLGEFMPMPVNVPDVTLAAIRLLESGAEKRFLPNKAAD
jgi:DNA-binding NtrC family response regulator